MVFGPRGDAFGQLRAHIGRDRVADLLLVEPAHQVVLVERAVAAQIEIWSMPPGSAASAFSTTRRLPEPAGTLACVGAGSSPLGRPFVAGNHRGVDIQRCRLHRPTALQIEDELSIGRGQTQQWRRLGGHARFTLLQQRQILGMELRQQIARRLRPPWVKPVG